MTNDLMINHMTDITKKCINVEAIENIEPNIENLLLELIKIERTSLNEIIKIQNKLTITETKQKYYDEVRTSDTTEYTSEKIYDFLNQNAKNVIVLNDGPGTIYVKYSSNGTSYSSEFTFYEGEAKKYTNVHTLKIRTLLTGVKYRVTEFEIWKQKNVDYKTGRGYIRNQTLVTGDATPATAYTTTDIHNVFTILQRNATTGYIKNRDSVAKLLCWISIDGTEYGQSGQGIAIEYFTVDPNSALNVDGWEVYSLKIGANQNNVSYEVALG